MTVKIERATSEYLNDIVAIARMHALDSPRHLERAATGFLVSGFDRSDYEDFIEHAEHFLTARVGDAIAGFLLAYSSSSIRENEWLNLLIKKRYPQPFVLIKQTAIHPDYARTGVATALYRHLLDVTSHSLLVTVLVEHPPNRASVAFHGALGFEKVFEEIPPDRIRRNVWIRRADT